MLEAKAKDEALFKLTRLLKYYNYQFIDETTFIIWQIVNYCYNIKCFKGGLKYGLKWIFK